jgi:predicted ATPase
MEKRKKGPRVKTRRRVLKTSGVMPTSERVQLVQSSGWSNVLTHLGYSNFKAFGRLELDTRPITVLLGPNNSGKSSILAGPKLLTQTTESFDASVTLLLNGIFGDYGTYRDIVFQNVRARPFEIAMTLRHRRDLFLSPVDERKSSSDVVSTLRLKYRYRSKLKQIVLSEIEVISQGELLLRTKYSEASERPLVTSLGGVTVRPAFRASISRRLRVQHFLPQGIALLLNRSVGGKPVGSRGELRIRRLSRAGRAFHRFFDAVEYVGAVRAQPARTFLFSGETRARVGAFGEHAINIMVMDSLRSGARSLGIQSKVISWLKRADVARDLQIRSLSDRHYEIRLRHPITKEYSNFADVGYGISQVIPVLVAGFNLRSGGTLLIEQPEIHLHPRAQAELGSFLCQLHSRRVQTVVETHSEHLVLRLQQNVANGVIPPGDVVFYYVHAKGGRKRAVKMILDDDGRFLGEWPEGFFPERLEEAKRLARARFRTG